MRRVDLYLDLTCPWSYLALVRLQDVTDRNAAAIRFFPVSVAAVLETENPGLQATRLSPNPAVAAWQQQDLRVWASMWGLPFRLPETWPEPGDLAAGALVAADAEGKALDYALAVYRAYFGGKFDIGDRQALVHIAASVGLEPDRFRARLEAAETSARVDANAAELVRRGGFGTPSMFVDDALFFGNDRIPLVEWTLGPISDAEFIMPGQHSAGPV